MDSTLARHYLKAMGITVWLPRNGQDSDTPVQTVETSAVQACSGARSIDVPDYLSQLSATRISLLRSGNGKLLIAIEPPSLASADMALLDKMLVAIGLESNEQGIFLMADDGDLTLADQLNRQQPDLLLVMIACGDSPASIEFYRSRHHSYQWSTVPVAFTHHPAELNLHPELKRPAWEDLKRIKTVLDG